MITEYEREMMRLLQEHAGTITDGAIEAVGADVDDSKRAQAVGNQLALMDALFAIREGTEWRGRTDPREIAREILRTSGIGDPES